ncbi:MAG: hypothetical protein IBJ15_01015 [Alphaproteobacteria bacterium]|nr:hypothetical protein [Alphaproteobacteria bacterium]
MVGIEKPDQSQAFDNGVRLESGRRRRPPQRPPAIGRDIRREPRDRRTVGPAAWHLGRAHETARRREPRFLEPLENEMPVGFQLGADAIKNEPRLILDADPGDSPDAENAVKMPKSEEGRRKRDFVFLRHGG